MISIRQWDLRNKLDRFGQTLPSIMICIYLFCIFLNLKYSMFKERKLN